MSSLALQLSVHGSDPYHRECYKKLFHPKCEICYNHVRFPFCHCDISVIMATVGNSIFIFMLHEPIQQLIHSHDLIMEFSYLQIPLNARGQIEYRSHPFWNQRYCPSHERDGSQCCCSCDRIEVCWEIILV